MKRKFQAVAFDLDGTLYPNYRLYCRLIPFILREAPLLWAFGKARNLIHAGRERAGDFYEAQARIIADILHVDAAQIQQKIETEIYRGWEPLFKRIRLYPHAAKTLAALKESGFKLGLLSDFPPDRKLENLGIAGIWDAVLCSEKEQALKPDRLPFDKLAAALGLESGKILYVGNSLRYDVLGAKRAGMGAALVCSSLKALRRNRASQIEDFAFHDYRQLLKYVLS